MRSRRSYFIRSESGSSFCRSISDNHGRVRPCPVDVGHRRPDGTWRPQVSISREYSLRLGVIPKGAPPPAQNDPKWLSNPPPSSLDRDRHKRYLKSLAKQ
jgi:hypothetical protein